MVLDERSPDAQAAEEEVPIPVSSELAASKGLSMAHGGRLKLCVVTALVMASMFVLLALNISVLVLTAKAYNITKQLGTAQVPIYSTGALTSKTQTPSYTGAIHEASLTSA